MKRAFLALTILTTFSLSLEAKPSKFDEFMNTIDPTMKNAHYAFQGRDCRIILNQTFIDFKMMTLCKSVSRALDILQLAFDNTKIRTYLRLYEIILQTNYYVINKDSFMCKQASAFAHFNFVNSIATINPKAQVNIDTIINMFLYDREYLVFFCPNSIFPGGIVDPSETVIHEAGHSHGFGECISESLSIMAVVDSKFDGTNSPTYREECNFGETWESAIEAAKMHLINIE